MKVYHHVNFNGRMVETEGTVLKDLGDMWLVSFVHKDVEFSGHWDKKECRSTPRTLLKGTK